MASCVTLSLATMVLGLNLPAGSETIPLPNPVELKQIDFERHISGLLLKLGCSAGSCHGSFQGRGGFRLSLFGHDPDKDFMALTHDAFGRRVDTAHPDSSLILLKATGQISHGGGKRFDKDSWQYRVIRAWIAQGCGRTVGSGLVKRIQVLPNEHTFRGTGETVNLSVVAEFADGTHADITPFCDFRMKDESIALVSPVGRVRSLQPGDSPVVVSYRGNLATARIFIPFPIRRDFIYPEVSVTNFIDREVFAKLRRLNIVPSAPADDAEFLRRVTIDTIGCLPAPDEIRAFLKDPRADKRLRKIEELLTHRLHAALWATKFCDITGCNVDVMDGPAELRSKRAKMWHDWFRQRFAKNLPYDQIVKGVLTATSRENQALHDWIRQEVALDQAARRSFDSRYAGRATLDLFWRRIVGEDFFPLEQMAELTATAFLGVRIECAQCHKHPFDCWTQSDYRTFANIFSEVQFGSSPETTAAVVDLLARRREQPEAGPSLPRIREVYISKHRPRRLLHPETNEILPAKALGGPIIDDEKDPRAGLYRWMIRPDNPYFAPSFVNRVWAHYFGVGLVEPVDNFSLANPPANARLMDALARDFIAHHFDIRRLERTILTSRTYQLSSVPNATNAQDRSNYSHAFARPMMAEVFVDVLNAALGAVEELGPDVPGGSRAIEIAPNRVQAPHLARAFRVFGRPARTSTCDCERPAAPTLSQALFLMADPALLQKIAGGRLKKLLSEQPDDARLTDELFLATLSRLPDADERQTALECVRNAKERKEAYMDLLWSLVNTREFILNH